MATLHPYFFGDFEAFSADVDAVFAGAFPVFSLPDLPAVSATAFGLAAVLAAAFGFFSTVPAALGFAGGLLAAFFESAFGLAFTVPTLPSSEGVAFAFALTGFLAG